MGKHKGIKTGPLSEEHKRNISKGCKGKNKGQIPWNKNIPCSEEQKRKISIANKGKIVSEETRRKSSISHLGQKAWNKGLTKETNERIREAGEKRKGENNPAKRPEVRKKMRDSKKGKNNPNYGKHRSEETKKKISKSNKGKKFSVESRKKMSNSMKGRSVWITGLTKETDERVKKISESRKGEKNPLYGKHLSEEHKRKISNALKGENNYLYGKHHTEEAKQKMREKILFRMQNNPGPYKDTVPELKMKEILTSLNISFEHQFYLEDCSFDFHLLNTNILIEVDGDYFHGNPKKFSTLNKMQLEMKERDKKHNEVAKNSNYILLRFWESDILNNTEEVKSIICSKIVR